MVLLGDRISSQSPLFSVSYSVSVPSFIISPILYIWKYFTEQSLGTGLFIFMWLLGTANIAWLICNRRCYYSKKKKQVKVVSINAEMLPPVRRRLTPRELTEAIWRKSSYTWLTNRNHNERFCQDQNQHRSHHRLLYKVLL